MKLALRTKAGGIQALPRRHECRIVAQATQQPHGHHKAHIPRDVETSAAATALISAPWMPFARTVERESSVPMIASKPATTTLKCMLTDTEGYRMFIDGLRKEVGTVPAPALWANLSVV